MLEAIFDKGGLLLQYHCWPPGVNIVDKVPCFIWTGSLPITITLDVDHLEY